MVEPRRLKFPLEKEEALSLRVGDSVLVSGTIVTARDKAHHYLFQDRPRPEELPFELEGGIIYHCGPIIRMEESSYSVVACGPTTSTRMDMYEWWIIENYGIRAIMGKGGMGEKTLRALKANGAVYLHAIGGAAVFLARRIKKVKGVFRLEEFGMPEAMWVMEAEDFPAIVTMDASGATLHETVKEASGKSYRRLLGLET